MTRAQQLQFQRLPAEAQRAALWRLALAGHGVDEVAQQTGWSADQVRRAMGEVPNHDLPPLRGRREAHSRP